jgi:hypothetical protein
MLNRYLLFEKKRFSSDNIYNRTKFVKRRRKRRSRRKRENILFCFFFNSFDVYAAYLE